MKRLNIVVPFRGREAHLQKFVPTVRAYFARDKLDRHIPYRVTIVEQDYELPFNRGAVKNLGFTLGRADSDYTCFHDVDYLPIWADYRAPDFPSAILWHGAEARAVIPGTSAGIVQHDLDYFFGGVFLAPNAMFEQVNGYANSYWGWGFEDNDLAKRFEAAGIRIDRRKGTFEPLEHNHEGFRQNGERTPISQINEAIFMSRWGPGANNLMADDGLSSLAYEILDRRPIPEGPVVEREAAWEIVKIRLLMRPQSEQMRAPERDRKPTFPAPVWGDARISRNARCPCGSGKKFKHCHGAGPR